MNPIFEHIVNIIEAPDGCYWERQPNYLYLRNKNETIDIDHCGQPVSIDEYEITITDSEGLLLLAARTDGLEKLIMACHAAAPGPGVEEMITKIKQLVEKL